MCSGIIWQAELDRVVGRDRAPTSEDFDRLPYIQAVIKECHRWRPVGPLSAPHATIEDINVRVMQAASTSLCSCTQ
jgi:cytochrome P450